MELGVSGRQWRFPSGFNLWHTPNHWANEETTIWLIKNIIPYIQSIRVKSCVPDQAGLVMYDVFKGHMGEAVQSLLEDNKIFYVTVPSNCTDILQPLVNKAFEDKLRIGFSEWYAEEVTKQMENGTQVDCVNVDMRTSGQGAE